MIGEGNEQVEEIRMYIEAWLRDERDYTIRKFGLETDEGHIKEWAECEDILSDDNEPWFMGQFLMYLHRAHLIGLDDPNGRQAFAKFVATAMGALEAVVREYGELPEPGVTSGENLDRLRPLHIWSGEVGHRKRS